jgi:probable HAF family extracellular repeat protein
MGRKREGGVEMTTRIIRSLFGASLIAALAMVAPGAASATDYTFTILLNSLLHTPDGADVIATGLNDAGQVIGWYHFEIPDYAFLYTNGSVTSFTDPGAGFTIPKGINNQGQIVGTGYYSFLYTDGSITTIEVPCAGCGTEANGINDRGQIVGYSEFIDSTGTSHFDGFLYTGGRFTTIDVPGAFETEAFGINNSGQIFGNFKDSRGTHGFLYTGGRFTTIDVPSASETTTNRINDRGQIVGNFKDSRGTHGFLYTGGGFTTIDVPGASETEANDINNRGQIVGNFSDNTGAHGFVYTGGKFITIDAPGGTPGSTVVNYINNAGQIVGSFFMQVFPISGCCTASFLADPVGLFAGTPGQANCISNSVSALVQKYGGEAAAASALGDSSILDLQNAVATYCGG